MAKGSINRAMVRRSITTAFKRSQAKLIAYTRAKRHFDRKKSELLSEFNNHSVTQEINAGPDGSNISGTLGGYGNLYSFIGFPGGNPVSLVSQYLMSSIRLYKTPTVKVSGSRAYFTFRGTMPSKKDLEIIAPMPWEPGSWLFKMESGISGLGSYIYGKMYAGSRSGSGIQSRHPVRGGLFTPIPYLSMMLANFKK